MELYFVIAVIDLEELYHLECGDRSGFALSSHFHESSNFGKSVGE